MGSHPVETRGQRPVSGPSAWIAANAQLLDRFRPRAGESLDERIDRGQALYAELWTAGITGTGWSESSGGSGGDAEDRAALYDALAGSGLDLPEHVAALEVLGPALEKFAPDIAAERLPAILSGREVWCQGFSEPEAGSDLASLRTVARRDGDDWVISGQKVWTSLAHRAQWCAVLARTGSTESRHRGLTLFWVDMASSGITVRPLDALTGEPEFSEVFIDDVRVPASSVVGEVDGGWAAAMYLLQFERGMWAWQRQARMHAMLDEALASGGTVDARALGAAVVALAGVRLRAHETVTRLAADAQLGPNVSVDKIALGQAEKIVNDVVVAFAPDAFLWDDAPELRAVRSEWFYSRAASVYGGAVEIQKGIIADRVLQLPREGQRG